jgi:hypothetical protein
MASAAFVPRSSASRAQATLLFSSHTPPGSL